VVSPYAKRGYVSHVQHEFGSILKFVEDDFGLPSLQTADSRSDDLIDCFDFKKAPAPFARLHAKVDAEYYLRKRPSLPPDDV
jgi:phospholipase C